MIDNIKEPAQMAFLVVEPEINKRSNIIAMLNRMGYEQVEFASDGAAAYNILKRRPIDVVLSAWDMPQMNGISLLKVLRSDEELYNVPFYIMTRHINRDKVMEAGHYGVTDILVEPVKPSMLKQKLNTLLNTKPDVDMEKIAVMFQKAKHLMEDGIFNKALRVYEDILGMHEDAEVYYNIGYIKASQGNFEEALKAFRKAVMIDHFHARAYKMMGVVYLKTGDPVRAEHCFEKAGDIFFEREMDDEAEIAFKEALKINPNTKNIYNSLGIIYRRQHKPKKAIALYQMAMKVAPDDEHIFYNIGRAYLEDRQIDKAKLVLNRALKMNPDFIEAKRLLEAIELGF